VLGAPASVFGITLVIATARSGPAPMGGVVRRCLASQPVLTVGGCAGIPSSIRVSASKCERVGSVEPAACTIARWPASYGVRSGAAAGARPKKPSRSTAPLG
jgi:hypothetical protein